MTQQKSGFILAGFETLANIIDNFILDTKNRFDDNFERDDINKFFGDTCSGFLHSFGQAFSNKKSYKNYNSSEASLLKRCLNTGFFKDSPIVIDSGGFQASIGKLHYHETELLIEHYHRFLIDHSDVYQKAFVLDLPPGPDCKLFNSFQDVYDMNLKTYKIAANLPTEVKNKMIYIHHFRTPKLWRIFKKIMVDNDLFKEFNYHATGGIVANAAGDIMIPCIIYILPLIPLLNECKRLGRDTLNFHILGGSTFRDILFYELFKIHILNKHGITVNFTYDSSGLFKGLMIARFIHADNGHKLVKMDIREANLENRFLGGERVIDKYNSILESLADDHNFKRIKIDKVYNPETKTFFEEIKIYTMLYMLNQFSYIQDKLKTSSAELYDLYLAGEEEEFIRGVSLTTQYLNNGKLTKKQKAKSNSVFNSLNMLTELDENHCMHIVDKLLYKDEFIKLDHNNSSMTI